MLHISSVPIGGQEFLDDDFPERCSLHEEDELNRKESGYLKKV